MWLIQHKGCIIFSLCLTLSLVNLVSVLAVPATKDDILRLEGKIDTNTKIIEKFIETQIAIDDKQNNKISSLSECNAKVEADIENLDRLVWGLIGAVGVGGISGGLWLKKKNGNGNGHDKKEVKE